MKTLAILSWVAFLLATQQQLHAGGRVNDPKLNELKKNRAILLGKSVGETRNQAILTHVLLLTNWRGV